MESIHKYSNIFKCLILYSDVMYTLYIPIKFTLHNQRVAFLKIVYPNSFRQVFIIQ